MIAIWPVGPPKLMKPSLVQKREASRNETPWSGCSVRSSMVLEHFTSARDVGRRWTEDGEDAR